MVVVMVRVVVTVGTVVVVADGHGREGGLGLGGCLRGVLVLPGVH